MEKSRSTTNENDAIRKILLLVLQTFRQIPSIWLTLATLIIFVIVFGLLADTFFRPANLLNIARQSSIIGIVSIAVLLTMLVGGIDLSVGSLAGLSGIVTAGVMADTGSIWLGIMAGLGVGTFFGFINGLVITRLGIQDIIATLAMLFVAHGLIYAYSGGNPIYSGIDRRFLFIGQGNIWGISMPIIFALTVAASVYFVLKYTRLGRQFYAVGGNSEVAFAAGINVKRVKTIAYSMSGFLCAIAGVIMTSRLGSGQPAAGETFLLDAVAAVILGGASLAGGMGGVPGTIIGILVIGVLSNGLTLIGAQYYMQEIFKGMMIVLAVLLNSLRDLRR
jgi:ribose/xylose/arabinose/galactoside ABC-type transport system permease subunit